MAGAMLDCAICSTRNWKPLEPVHEEDLQMAGAARLFCENCTRETFWLYSQHSEGASAMRRTAEPPSRANGTVIGEEQSSGTARAEPAGSGSAPIRAMHANRRIAADRRSRTRRVQSRVALQIPVRLRLSTADSQFEEVTKTVNVCRNGIYIQSERPYGKGSPVYVAMNYSPREPALTSEQKATVVRVDALAGTPAHGFAIELH